MIQMILSVSMCWVPTVCQVLLRSSHSTSSIQSASDVQAFITEHPPCPAPGAQPGWGGAGPLVSSLPRWRQQVNHVGTGTTAAGLPPTGAWGSPCLPDPASPPPPSVKRSVQRPHVRATQHLLSEESGTGMARGQGICSPCLLGDTGLGSLPRTPLRCQAERARACPKPHSAAPSPWPAAGLLGLQVRGLTPEPSDGGGAGGAPRPRPPSLAEAGCSASAAGSTVATAASGPPSPPPPWPHM